MGLYGFQRRVVEKTLRALNEEEVMVSVFIGAEEEPTARGRITVYPWARDGEFLVDQALFPVKEVISIELLPTILYAEIHVGGYRG